MSLFNELKRRNVFRVAAAYVIIGWLILQVGEVLGPALLLPGWVNSLLAFFLLLGFPLAMFFAWAFELTPEGIKKEAEVDRSASITNVTGQKLNHTIIGLLLLAVGYFAWDKFLSAPQPATGLAEDAADVVPADDGVHSIAVLPLADMSPDGNHEYFSDGLTEELLNILAKIKYLQVAGRTSSFAFKGKNEDLREIGRKLNVESILEGSVRKDEVRNRVRITLQLIKVEDGFHLWSETYDRDLDDIFAIQEEVAHEVADALRVTLLGEDEARLTQSPTTDINAYDLYLQALGNLNLGGYAQLETATRQFQQVLLMDPDYQPARLGLVRSYQQLARTGAITLRDSAARGEPLVESVLRAQPDNSDAHFMKAVYLGADNQPEAAEASFQRALELNPANATALAQYGRFLFDNLQTERGMGLIEQALRVEPYDIQVLWHQCQTNAYLGRQQPALNACNRIRELAPDSPQGYYGNALAYYYVGDLGHAIVEFERAIKRDPTDFEMLAGISQYWSSIGDLETAGAWLQQAESIGAGQPVPLVGRIVFLNAQEQDARAGELAARALSQGLDDRFGSEYVFRQVNAYQQMLSGNHEQALAPFRAVYPWVFDAGLPVPENPWFQVEDLLVIAAVLRAQDPLSSRWQELVSFVEPFADQHHPGWGPWQESMRRARIATLNNEPERAIEHIRTAIDKGFFGFYQSHLINDPVLHALKQEPAFQQLVAELDREAERQRQLAHTLLAAQP